MRGASHHGSKLKDCFGFLAEFPTFKRLMSKGQYMVE